VDTTDGSDTRAKNTNNGRVKNASRRNVGSSDNALKTWLETSLASRQSRSHRRLTPEDIHARLIFTIGVILALVFLIVTAGITYALIFVTQPIGAQAPNDAAFIDLLKTLAIFLTGALGGVLAGNGLKSKDKLHDTPNHTRES
jgi:hypothetical protein